MRALVLLPEQQALDQHVAAGQHQRHQLFHKVVQQPGGLRTSSACSAVFLQRALGDGASAACASPGSNAFESAMALLPAHITLQKPLNGRLGGFVLPPTPASVCVPLASASGSVRPTLKVARLATATAAGRRHALTSPHGGSKASVHASRCRRAIGLRHSGSSSTLHAPPPPSARASPH